MLEVGAQGGVIPAVRWEEPAKAKQIPGGRRH